MSEKRSDLVDMFCVYDLLVSAVRRKGQWPRDKIIILLIYYFLFHV